jgi:hypothetical protein
VSKRKETRWIEINLTERETKLLCAAAGTTVKTFELSNVPRVENYVRKAAVAVAKRQLNLEKAAKKW